VLFELSYSYRSWFLLAHVEGEVVAEEVQPLAVVEAAAVVGLPYVYHSCYVTRNDDEDLMILVTDTDIP